MVRYLLIANLIAGDLFWYKGQRARLIYKRLVDGLWRVAGFYVDSHKSFAINGLPEHGKLAMAYPSDDKPAEGEPVDR